jgi:hypothetical protein
MIRLPKVLLVGLTLALLAGLATPSLAAEMVKGKIKEFAADKDRFVLTDREGKDWTFHLSEAARVFVNEKAARLQDLKEGFEATVTYSMVDDKRIASEIRTAAGLADGTTKGQIKTVTANRSQFVLTDTNGNDFLFTLLPQAKVSINDRDGRLQDLKAGDRVHVSYERRPDGGLYAKELRTVAK